jgi:hypothetical protein
MTKPKVWVIKEQVRRSDNGASAMDYTPAMVFGELEFITEFDLPLHAQSTVATQWSKAVTAFLVSYDPAEDFIILTGSPLAIFLVGIIVGRAAQSASPKILVWRREQGRYIEFSPEKAFSAIVYRNTK